MEVKIDITDKNLENFVKKLLSATIDKMNIEQIVESKVQSKFDKTFPSCVSKEKIEQFSRDRISRIITVESLKDFTSGINDSEVLSNVESKILLMIKNSNEFKSLVKSVLKESLA